jgi:CBS-domain-containing membrane protein
MTNTSTPRSPLVLEAATAADLMTPEPVTIAANATLKEAILLLADRRISAAPVVDDAGRAIGVVSLRDIVEHDRETVRHAPQAPEYFTRRDLARAAGEELPGGYQVESVDRTRACDLMTPVVFSVRPEASAEQVVQRLVNMKIHRLFVVDGDGVLVGLISTTDVVRNLLPGHSHG